jgi:hypothetical protein
MQWANGIAFKSGRFWAELSRSGGALELVRLKSLLFNGLPDERTEQLSFETNFADWKSCDAAEYLGAWGKGYFSSTPTRHLVYALSVPRANLKILVPALAIIRAIFRPTVMLPTLFTPQALDRACHLDLSCSPPRAVIDANWTASSLRKHRDFSPILAWLKGFPSASRMTGSVHEHAREGVIGISLPDAISVMSVFGKRVDDALLVTKLWMRNVTAIEPPFPFAPDLPNRVFYRNPNPLQHVASDRSIILQEDGSVDVSDREWAVIEPILVSRDSRKRRHDPRLLFDGVLRKFALGRSWNKTPYRTGRRENAVYAYQQWKSAGAYSAAIEALRDLRSGYGSEP